MPTNLDYDDNYNRSTWMNKHKGSKGHLGYQWDIALANVEGGKEFLFEVDEQRLCYFQLDEQSRRMFEEPCPIIKDDDDRYLMVSPEAASKWRERHAKRDEQGFLRVRSAMSTQTDRSPTPPPSTLPMVRRPKLEGASTGSKRRAGAVGVDSDEERQGPPRSRVQTGSQLRPKQQKGRGSTQTVDESEDDSDDDSDGAARDVRPVAPAPAVVRAPSRRATKRAPTNKLYNDPTGDLVVVSADGAEARVRAHKFKAISDLVCDLVDGADDPARVTLDESADDVGLLLRFSLDPKFIASREVEVEASLKIIRLLSKYKDVKGLALSVTYLSDHVEYAAPDVFAASALAGDTVLARRALQRIGSIAASAHVGNSVTFCSDALHTLLDGMSPALLTKVPTSALRPVYVLIEQVRMPSAQLAPLPYATRWAELVKSFELD